MHSFEMKKNIENFLGLPQWGGHSLPKPIPSHCFLTNQTLPLAMLLVHCPLHLQVTSQVQETGGQQTPCSSCLGKINEHNDFYIAPLVPFIFYDRD